jgi:3-oxoadipate enol-lactonase
MPHAQVNGIELYYEVAGSGNPLLLINGLGGNAVDWEPLLPALCERFRVIAFDNRGVGRSSAPPGPYTTHEMAGDAAALLEYLGVPRTHVVGSSMGGMIAQKLALAHPERVDRLVLFATFARPRRAIMDSWLTFLVQTEERGLDLTGPALWGLPWLFTPQFMAQPERVEEALAWQEPYPAPLHGIAGQAEAVRSHDTLDRLPRITAPTLVLVGAEDVLTPVYYSQELAAGIPGARLQVLAHGGHAALWEDPETGIEALLTFLTPGVDDAVSAHVAP